LTLACTVLRELALARFGAGFRKLDQAQARGDPPIGVLRRARWKFLGAAHDWQFRQLQIG
jgi:hypothetical protein